MDLDVEYLEAADLFPALYKYKAEHTTANFQKLCVEIEEFCNAIYASTQSQTERDIYISMLSRLYK